MLWKSPKLWKTLWKVWKTFKIKGAFEGKLNFTCGKLSRTSVKSFFENRSFSSFYTTPVSFGCFLRFGVKVLFLFLFYRESEVTYFFTEGKIFSVRKCRELCSLKA